MIQEAWYKNDKISLERNCQVALFNARISLFEQSTNNNIEE